VASSLEKGSFITEVEGLAYFSEDNKASGTKERFLNLGKQGLEVVGDQYRGLAVFNNSKKITEFYEASLDVYTRRNGGP